MSKVTGAGPEGVSNESEEFVTAGVLLLVADEWEAGKLLTLSLGSGESHSLEPIFFPVAVQRSNLALRRARHSFMMAGQ